MARRRKQARGRWFDRLFWLGVLGVAAWFALPRIARPILAASGYHRVEQHAGEIRAAAREFRIDPNLLAGIAMAESSGRVGVVSEAGALGMFQLMLPTARERARLLRLPEPTREDLLGDAALNARLAASYLRWLLDRYDGEEEPALVAYNAGPGRLKGWIAEHRDYAAWRAARVGRSPVLAYAQKVQKYRHQFEARGVVAPTVDRPPAPPVLSTAHPLYGPPIALPQDDLDVATPLAADPR